jgi:hypothetical protein
VWGRQFSPFLALSQKGRSKKKEEEARLDKIW